MRLIHSLLILALIFSYTAPLALAEGESDPLWNRPSFEKKVYTIGQRLLQANGISERIVFIYNSHDIRNAYADRSFGSENTVVIYKDMLDVMESDDELAAILGHEIAHITERHHGKATARAIPAKILVGSLAVAALSGGGIVSRSRLKRRANQLSGPMMKSLETEADEVGLDYMVKAGYNPLAMERILSKGTGDAGPITTFMSSHPTGTKRLDHIREQIQEKYPEFLTPEIAASPPGTAFVTQAQSDPNNYDAFYDKLNMIAKNGSTESSADQTTTTATDPLAPPVEGYNPTTDAEASKAATTKPATTPLRATPAALNLRPSTPPAKDTRVANAATATSKTVVNTDSVLDVLLSLSPDELRLVKALRREKFADRQRLMAELGGVDYTTLDILLNSLRTKKLIRIVGNAQDEIILLSDRVVDELQP